MAGDQRKFTRITFHTDSRLQTEDGARNWQVQLLDLSLRGALILKPADWNGQPGDLYQLLITLGEADDAPRIEMAVEVAHRESSRVGLHCHHIDIDSIAHLRRLIALNTGSDALLERELSQLRAED